MLAGVAEYLAAEHGIEVVGTLGFENTYTLAMRSDDAQRRGVDTLTELARHASELEIGGDYEFFARAEWRALESVYGLAFRKQRAMDGALMYQAVAGGEVDVISAYSTDGRIASLGLRVIRDDRGVIPPYDAIVLASPMLSRDRPDVVEALRRLAGTIDAARMQEMNDAVDAGGQAPAAVARAFLDAMD